MDTATTDNHDEQIHRGHDGWMFLLRGECSIIDLYRDDSLFTDTLAREWVELLRDRRDRLSARGIDYVHLAVPDKLTLLGTHYAGEIENPGGSPIRQLMDRYDWDLPAFLNVVPYLSQQVDNYPVYWKSDTHWSAWGCYLAYQMLCSRLHVPTNEDILNYPFVEQETVLELGARVEPPQTETLRTYRLDRFSRRTYANPVVRYMEAQHLTDDALLHPGSHVVFHNDSPEAADQVVILFGQESSDFRRHLLTGMLAETVRELHFIWSDSIDDEYVRQVRPDIVITEMAEGRMTTLPVDGNDCRADAERRLEAFSKRGDLSARLAAAMQPESRIDTRTVFDSEIYPLAPPLMVQEDCDPSLADVVMKTNPVELVSVQDAMVYFTGERALVEAPGGEEILRYSVDDARAARVRGEESRRLRGRTLLLAPTPGAHCYYHWMMDILPKLGVLHREGIESDHIDHFLVREITGDFQRQTLAHLGIDLDRVVETVRDQYLVCDELVHVDMNNFINMKMHRFVPLWLKHAFAQRPECEERIRLYISRPEGVRRGIRNEEAMRPLLEAHGFKLVAMEGLSVLEQVRLLARADVVMSPHGGALTNMVFCRPGIQVVELMSRHVYPYYYGLASMCGHRYHAILENPGEDYSRLVSARIANTFADPSIQWQTHDLSFDVSLDALEQTLDAL